MLSQPSSFCPQDWRPEFQVPRNPYFSNAKGFEATNLNSIIAKLVFFLKPLPSPQWTFTN
jgi:hypothetical protein